MIETAPVSRGGAAKKCQLRARGIKKTAGEARRASPGILRRTEFSYGMLTVVASPLLSTVNVPVAVSAE